MTITSLSEDRFDDFVRLIRGLAEYEHLAPPDEAATERLRADAFGPRKRFEAAVAVDDEARAVGYAVWYETYSTFRAAPSMFLEDIFVTDEARGLGVGGALFDHVRALGQQRGCAQMEWIVLDWNAPARDFYHRRDAHWMREWLLYRLTY